MEHEIWCRRMKAYRVRRGYTQLEVANALNLSRSHYSCLENGRNVINYKHLYNLSKFFRIRLSVLMTLKPPKKKKK